MGYYYANRKQIHNVYDQIKSKVDFEFCLDIIDGKDDHKSQQNYDSMDIGQQYPNSVLGKIINKNKGQIIKTNPIILVPDECIFGNITFNNAKDFIT